MGSRHPVWRWVILSALCAGCYGTSDDDDDDNPAAIAPSVEDFSTRANQIFCSKLYECCSADELSLHPAAGQSIEECEQKLAYSLAVYSESVASQRAVYDASLGGECVLAYGGVSCDDPVLTGASTLQSCADALSGAIPLGGLCEQAYECVDSTCDYEAGATCAARKDVGAFCTFHDNCLSGYCFEGHCFEGARPSVPFCQGG